MEKYLYLTNTALNLKQVKKLEEIFDKNEFISGIKIYTTRESKEDSINTIESRNFDSVRELIKYLEEKEIEYLNKMRINIFCKSKNMAILEYESFEYRWKLSYDKQDVNIDSLILNLRQLMKNNIFKIYRQYREFLVITFCVSWLLFQMVSKITISSNIVVWVNLINIILFADVLFVKNMPFKENRFISRNKDEIKLSILSFLAGIFATEIITIIKGLIK